MEFLNKMEPELQDLHISLPVDITKNDKVCLEENIRGVVD